MKNTFLLLTFLLSFTNLQAQKNKLNLIVGTYTNSCDSNGIYIYDFDTTTGTFALKNTSDKTISPSYLTIANNQKIIYTVNENGKESSISAFGFDPKTGTLKLLNTQNSNGADPCYIINDNQNVMVANYSGGTIAVYGKNSDGRLSQAKQVIQHFGKGKNSDRQQSPHVHMVQFSPDQKYILANDLGNDKIYSYQYNPNAENEILKLKDTLNVKAGSGPRHGVFSNNGHYFYLLQELDGTLTTFNYSDGILKKIEESSILAQSFAGETSGADIHITPDGKFLYATNRGTANTISIFKIQPNGKLILLEIVSTLGKKPRNFAIDPSGNFLLIAHQDSNDIVIFRRNIKTGKLTPTGGKITVCAPVCLVFSK
jgi:6-phosphogluconolactonase